MPYDSDELTPTDTTKAVWALAWARFLTGDTDGTAEIYNDQEWLANLEVEAVTIENVKYYRPHATVGRLLAADTSAATQFTILSVSVKTTSRAVAAQTLMRQNTWMDSAINDALDAASVSDSVYNYARPPGVLELTT